MLLALQTVASEHYADPDKGKVYNAAEGKCFLSPDAGGEAANLADVDQMNIHHVVLDDKNRVQSFGYQPSDAHLYVNYDATKAEKFTVKSTN